MTTFTFIPSTSSAVDTQPRVRTAKFGDGYQQRVGDGINRQPRMWNLQFEGRHLDEADDIVAFFEAADGTESFDWTPPVGAAGKWVCKSWVRSLPSPAIHNITTTFEEVFGD